MDAPHAPGVLGVARSIRLTTANQASPLVLDYEGVRAVGYSVPGALVETIGPGDNAPVHATTQDAVVLLLPPGDVPPEELAQDAVAAVANNLLAATEAGPAEAPPLFTNADSAVPHDAHELEEGEIEEYEGQDPRPPTPASWFGQDAYEPPVPDVENAIHPAAVHERSALMYEETTFFDPSSASGDSYHPATITTPYSAYGGLSYSDDPPLDAAFRTPTRAAPAVNTVLAPDDSISNLAHEDPAQQTVRALANTAVNAPQGDPRNMTDEDRPSAGRALSGITPYAQAMLGPQAIPPPTWSTPVVEEPRTIDPRRVFSNPGHTLHVPDGAHTGQEPPQPPALEPRTVPYEEYHEHYRYAAKGLGTRSRLENLPCPLPSSVRSAERDMHAALHAPQPNRSARRATRAQRPSPFKRPAAPRLAFAEPAGTSRKWEKSRRDPSPVAGPSRTFHVPPAHDPYPSRVQHAAAPVAGASRLATLEPGSSRMPLHAAAGAHQHYYHRTPPSATVYGIAAGDTASPQLAERQPMIRAIHAGAVRNAMSPNGVITATVPYRHFLWVTMELAGMETDMGEEVRELFLQRRNQEIHAHDGDLFVQYDGREMQVNLNGRRIRIPVPATPDSSAAGSVEFSEASEDGIAEASTVTGYADIPCRNLPIVDFSVDVAGNLAARDPKTPNDFANPQQDIGGRPRSSKPRARRILNTLVDYRRTRAPADDVLDTLDGTIRASAPPWSQQVIWDLRRLHVEAFYAIVSYANREGFTDTMHASHPVDYVHLGSILRSLDHPESFWYEELGNPFLWVMERRRLAAARAFFAEQVILLGEYGNTDEERAMIDLIDYLLDLDVERGYQHELFALRYTNILGLPGYPPDEALRPFRHN